MMNHRYTGPAIFLHWLIALGLIGIFALGFYMHDLPLTPIKLKLYSWHKWAGATLFIFVLIRLGWRLTHAAPALPATMTPALRRGAHLAHWLLYGLMLAIPLSGWLMSSALGFQLVWFGLVPLPDLLVKDAALGEQLKQVHKLLNFAMLGLVVMHTGAALKHHFLDRDTVLTRMLPVLKKS